MKSLLLFLMTIIGTVAKAQTGIGTLDSTFGVNGIVSDSLTTAPAVTLSESRIYKIMPLGDGRLLAMGDTVHSFLVTIVLHRYLENGAVDMSYHGGKGISYLSVDTTTYGLDATMLADGKILITGYANVYTNKLLCMRVKTDGNLDSTFGTDGVVRISPPAGYSGLAGKQIAVQSDGKILLAGTAVDTAYYSQFMISRLNADGSPDLSFNGTGMLIKSFVPKYNNLYSMALLQSGKIVVLGDYYSNPAWTIAAMRVNTNGSVDSTFGTDGVVTRNFGGNANYGYAIVEQSDKKLIAGVVATDTANHSAFVPDCFLLRLNEDGSTDNSWGSSGVVKTHFLPGDYPCFLDIKSTGKLLFGGRASSDSALTGYLYIVARFNSDGSPDNSFGMAGVTETYLPNSSAVEDYPYAMSVDLYSKTLVLSGVTNYANLNLMKYKLEHNVAVPTIQTTVTNISVYPNPAADKTQLDFYLKEPAHVYITLNDITGRTLKIVSVNNLMLNGRQHLSVDMHDLVPGHYFLNMWCDHQHDVMKVTKY
ncbi:MAG: T9SS type A sorting domain-containing protein [Flavipsychrobacter sp.]